MSAPATTDFDLLVLGDCNPDLVLQANDPEPSFGQVERLVDAADLTIGGSGAIIACGAARLGLRTAIAGVVGDDLFGRFMIDALAERGVDTSPVVIDATAKTGLTVILARPEDRALLTFPGAMSALTVKRLDPRLVRRARHVHVSSFFLQTSLAPGLPGLFEAAHAGGASTSLDPNWDPDELWDAGLHDLLPFTDVFLPNSAEATRIADRTDVHEAAARLAAVGPLVAVKLGAQGAVGAEQGKGLTKVASLSGIDPVDTIGAGDSFDAGVLAGLLNGYEVERALVLGCSCGALSTRAVGGTGAQPTLDEALDAIRADIGARQIR